jgi:surface protein
MDMRSMFKGCKGLYELDLSSFSTKSINTLNDMFGNINHELKVKVNRDNAERIVDEYEYHEYVKLEF